MFDITKALIPKPQKITYKNKLTKIGAFNKSFPEIVCLCGTGAFEEAKKIIEKKLAKLTALPSRKSDYTIVLETDADNPEFTNCQKSEAYVIDISDRKAVLCGSDTAGLFYAATTFVQLMFADGDNLLLPECHISDYPSFKRRGHFIESRYGSEFATLEDWCRFIDYMASMKLNSLTIGVYGCWGHQYDDRKMEYMYVPISKYPQLKTPKNSKYYSVRNRCWIHEDNILPPIFDDDFFGSIVAYGKRKNITVKPLVNSLGHNTLIPRMIPEIAAKNEDGTSKEMGFCTSSDKTYEVIFDIYDEITEKYLKPNEISDFHIGLDEVAESYVCHCEKCDGKKHSQLMVEHIIKLCKHLKKRGIENIYIYHDMLWQEFDIINDELKNRFISEEIYDSVVIDWWSYEDPIHLFNDNADKVNNIFRSIIKPDTGYYHWAIPTENNENIRACANLARKLSFEGVESYSSMEYCYDKNYLTLADVSWNVNEAANESDFNERYSYRCFPENHLCAVKAFDKLSQIMKDETRALYINRACYKLEYYFYGYRNRQTMKPKDFPGGVYKLISENESEYLEYLKFLKSNSKYAVDFFAENDSFYAIGNVWLLTAMHYYTLADEYLTIYSLHKKYNASECDATAVTEELKRLVIQREKLMSLAEDVRITSNQSTYLRNMSIFRQYILDLYDYFKKELSDGKRPKLDVMDLSYALSERFEFLR